MRNYWKILTQVVNLIPVFMILRTNVDHPAKLIVGTSYIIQYVFPHSNCLKWHLNFVSLTSIAHSNLAHSSKSCVAMLYFNGISSIHILLDILCLVINEIKFANG